MFEDPLIKLPHGWRKAKIKDVCELINGRAFKPTEWSTSGKPIIRIQNLNNPDTQYNYCNFDVDSKYLVENGQLLFAWSGTPDTSFGAHIWRRDIGVLNQHIFKIDIEENLIDKLYLMYFLNNNVKRYVRSAHGTAGLAHITKAKFQESIILIPPLPEQRAIVSKLEQLFSDLDNGIANLRLAQEQLKVYRQAVLKKAFEGELTRKWREQQTDLPDARDLLEQIRKEREEAAKASGKKVKPVKPLTEGEIAELPGLPEGWRWVKVDYILSDNNKGMTTGPFGTALKKYEHQKSGIPVYGIENIGEGVFRMPNKIFITEEKARELQAFSVKPYDIIISRSGTVGEICYIPEKINSGIISTNLIRVRLNLDVVSPNYFVYLFQGGIVREQVKEVCKGSTRAFLNQTILSSIYFPLCSIPEQHAIVEEIETRLSVCDKMAQDIDEALDKAEALRQIGRAHV